jgi:Zn-dependent protease with chaperone function
MTFEVRFVVIVLAAFAWSSVAASWLVAGIWRRRQRGRPVTAAATLLRLRLMPLGIGSTVALLAAIAFFRFEPRIEGESTGVVLVALAASSFAFAVSSAVRLWRISRITRRTVRGWMAGAEPLALEGITVPAFAIDATFPVVAVSGLIRPKLLIARSVLAACGDEELRAILTHEQVHIDRADNLRRLVLSAAPDVLAFFPLSGRIQSAWLQAVEDAADDGAGRRLGDAGRVVLAQALIRVARLASSVPPVTLPASALYRGENLDRRVRRLLAPPAAAVARPAWTRRGVAAALFAASLLALEKIHDVLEAAVTFLP